MWTEQDNLGEQIPVIGICTVCVNQQSIAIKEHKTPILVKKMWNYCEECQTSMATAGWSIWDSMSILEREYLGNGWSSSLSSRGVSLDGIGVFIELDQGRPNKSCIICSTGLNIFWRSPNLHEENCFCVEGWSSFLNEYMETLVIGPPSTRLDSTDL